MTIITVPGPYLPDTPCPTCGAVKWARFPFIGGKEFACTVCYPIRTWPCFDAEAHKRAIDRRQNPQH